MIQAPHFMENLWDEISTLIRKKIIGTPNQFFQLSIRASARLIASWLRIATSFGYLLKYLIHLFLAGVLWPIAIIDLPVGRKSCTVVLLNHCLKFLNQDVPPFPGPFLDLWDEDFHVFPNVAYSAQNILWMFATIQQIDQFNCYCRTNSFGLYLSRRVCRRRRLVLDTSL